MVQKKEPDSELFLFPMPGHRETKFGLYGDEMIEKEVKQSGNSGRVYLPLDWLGKHVKIIRID